MLDHTELMLNLQEQQRALAGLSSSLGVIMECMHEKQADEGRMEQAFAQLDSCRTAYVVLVAHADHLLSML